MTAETKEYLRAREVARLLGLSFRTVRRRIADGTFPSRRIGGARLVLRSELEMRIKEHREKRKLIMNDMTVENEAKYRLGNR